MQTHASLSAVITDACSAGKRILECVKPPFFTAETVALVTSASVIGLLLVLAAILGLTLFQRLSAELDRMRVNRIKRR